MGQTRRTLTISWKKWSETCRQIKRFAAIERMLVCVSTNQWAIAGAARPAAVPLNADVQ